MLCVPCQRRCQDLVQHLPRVYGKDERRTTGPRCVLKDAASGNNAIVFSVPAPLHECELFSQSHFFNRCEQPFGLTRLECADG